MHHAGFKIPKKIFQKIAIAEARELHKDAWLPRLATAALQIHAS